MIANLRYASYIVRHKWFVLRAGRVTGAPLWRLLVHDLSKLTLAEWGPYKRRFYGGRAGELDKDHEPAEFMRAWTRHWQRNPHHWENWLVLTDSGQLRPTPMPDAVVREMVADWMGAGRTITGRWEVAEWYSANGDKMILHPAVRERVDELIASVTNG